VGDVRGNGILHAAGVVQASPLESTWIQFDRARTPVQPECLSKWQLIRLDMLVASYQGMLKWYGKLAPMQDKIFKYMEREINDMEESDGWKFNQDDDTFSSDTDDLG